MKKGFIVKCRECNKELVIEQGYDKSSDSSKIVISVFGDYPHQSLFVACVDCNENEVEFDL